jgi:hypothetical protein
MVSMISWLREHPRVAAGGACVVALAAGVGIGRYAAPTKVETRERVVEVYKADEKAVARAVSDARSTWEREVKDNTRIVTKYVEGKVVERVEYRDRDTTSSGGKVETETVEVVREVKVEVVREVEKERIVTRDAPRLTLGATVGYAGVPTYGGFATVRILGPLTLLGQGEGGVGVWSARVGAGISF